MRKYYIVWWAISAYFTFIFIQGLIRNTITHVPLLLLFIGISFYVGYRRWVEYQEYQEDRKTRNEFYKNNTKDE